VLSYISIARQQSKTEFLKQKNAFTALRDQSSNNIDKPANIQDKIPTVIPAIHSNKYKIFVNKSKKM